MTKRHPRAVPASALLSLLLLGCGQTYHPVVRSDLGGPSSRGTSPLASAESRLNEPGPIRFRKIVAADWAVPRSGLINLHHPKARAAGLKNESEPIQIYFYQIDHPQFGAYLIDSGVARSVAERREDMPLKFPVKQMMPIEELVVRVDTETFLDSRETPLAGVFLTHLHLDHVLGLSDVPRSVPIYIGPGEAQDGRLSHPLVRPTLSANLQGFSALRQLPVWRAPGERLASVDVFGDGSLIGILVPGHTGGSMAFLLRTTNGPELLTGDACHTRWGWEHDVEPGTFNTNGKTAAESLAALRALAARHPEMAVHLGHQSLDGPT
jgi:glyoxylase-like metal-dependent hydrolase (beta-lactamase superfamily II)